MTMNLLFCLLLWQPASAFQVMPRSQTITNVHQRVDIQQRISSQKQISSNVLFATDKEEEEVEEPKFTSFDDAGRTLIDEDDTKKMEAMGDYDENPMVRACMNECQLPSDVSIYHVVLHY